MDLPPLVVITLGGALGALANVALGNRTIVLPRVEGHCIRLGFLGQLVLCVSVAWVVDHDLQTAFLASLAGTSLLRHVKRQIEQSFGGVGGRADDDRG